MINETKALLNMQIKNMYGLNVIKYTKDKNKKRNYIIISIFIEMFALMVLAYIGLISFGLIKLGLANTVPTLLFSLASLMVFVFSVFSASSSLFKMNDYEILMSLPVKNRSIVISRFLAMYLGDLEICIFTMLPGVIVYGILVKPFFTFYLYSLIGAIFIPMIPLVLSTLIGMIFTFVLSRIKNKSIYLLIFMIFLGAAFVFFLASISRLNIDSISQSYIMDKVNSFNQSIKNAYFPSKLFSDSVINNNFLGILIYIIISLALFVLMVLVIEKAFYRICNALNTKYTYKKFELKGCKEERITIALLKREIKRLFSSSIYLTNSIVGLIIMIVLASSLFFVDINELEEIIKINDITKLIPIILAIPAIISPTTASSISMEGKEVWFNQTMPIKHKDIYNSKILTNLVISLPFYLISVIISLIALKPGFIDMIFIILIPIFLIAYISIIGISINLRFPNLVWDSEIAVVKQSLATLISMIVGIITGLISLGLMFLFDNKYICYSILIVILIGLSTLFYNLNLNCKKVYK